MAGVDGYRCQCTDGYIGDECQVSLTKCNVHLAASLAINLVGDQSDYYRYIITVFLACTCTMFIAIYFAVPDGRVRYAAAVSSQRHVLANRDSVSVHLPPGLAR